MYSAPRAATVRAATPTRLWGMARRSYASVRLESQQQQRDELNRFWVRDGGRAFDWERRLFPGAQ
jgi:hypothetical protein